MPIKKTESPVDAVSNRHSLAVACNGAHWLADARAMAELTNTDLLRDVDPAATEAYAYLLLYDENGVSLSQTGRGAPGRVRADFVSGRANHRRLFGGGKGQMIARAVGLKAGVKPDVLDVTAGLGQDGFVLATLGCRVTLLERSPFIHAITADGLRRAGEYVRRVAGEAGDAELAAVLARLELHRVEAKQYLSLLVESRCPDVIYLDPMFPARSKTARVKKEMRMFQDLVGKDPDAGELLALALEKARRRVVVKRPRRAPAIEGRKPDYTLEGKSSRYDIYALARIIGRAP